jgi:L-seryl-tRNA(Ser) seleniumtransferase
MNDTEKARLLRSIPAIDEILHLDEIVLLRSAHPRFPWTRFLRGCVDQFRALVKAGKIIGPAATPAELITEMIAARMEELKVRGVRRVINGTGVILHTNLGRAVLGRAVQEDIRSILDGYVNLEFDLERGERGKRGEQMHRLIQLATGAQASMVVNNNAAAVYLIANTFSPPGRVLISRGELVEIGGSFRLPTILASAANEVLEIGTTNRTYIKDYAKHARGGDVLLKVHRSNYEIEGFAHEASLQEIVECARAAGGYSVYDLGSGALFDFAGAGLAGEEQVERVLESGVDCVTMSGDKLLGGVQAGIIVGSASVIEALKANPLSRAVRIDKLGIAAVESLFRSYLFSADPGREIPVLEQSIGPLEELRIRAHAIIEPFAEAIDAAYTVSVVEDAAAIGGGSFARQEIAGIAVALTCESEKSAVAIARRMRQLSVPLIPRIRGRELRFNLRSMPQTDDAELGRQLELLLKKKYDD